MKKLFLLLTAIVTLAMSAMAQNRTYTGTVLSSADDEPLIGATVTPIGGGHATMTDVNGQFTLSVPASVKEVKVTYVGMSPKTVALKDGIKIYLDNSATLLDQVVVTGYGSGKKLGSVVGSVNVVGTEVMEATPSSNFVDALQGQVPGLAIFSNSGEPSSVPSEIRIRGINSLTASNTPLFILDGAPVTSSVFTTLSPADIENVTVLKDAASTAIYGSRAANGVIVITTKKGKYGDNARVSIRANVGWSQLATDKVDLMDSEQYIQFRELVKQPVSQEVKDLVSNYGINTDWRKELIKDDALMYSIESRVTGGSSKTRYYLSLAHYDQDGLIEKSGIRRETLRSNIDAKINDWFSVGLSSNFGYETYETNSAASGSSDNGGIYVNNPIYRAYNILPYDSPYYYDFNEKGDIIYGDRAKYYHYSGYTDPSFMNQTLSPGKRTNATATMNLYEQITPIRGLTIRAQQAMNAFDYRSSSHRPAYPDPIITPMGDKIDFSQYVATTSEAFQRWYRFTFTNTAEYKFKIAEQNDFTFLIGQEAITERNNAFNVATTGQPSASQWLLTQGTNVTISNVGQSLSKSVINSYFFNFSYNFAERYFLDFNIRRDASSKFAPDHRWATFYAVGAMWNIKNEKFMQNVNWLSDMKLRVNYGTTGNSGISDYQYQGTATSGNIYNGEPSLGLSKQPNPDLTWETVRSFDAGIDVGFLDNRIRTTADFYVKNTIDMLMNVPRSNTTGYDSMLRNVGGMRNIGVDVDFYADIYRSKDWYVGASVNFNYNKNTITELFDGLEEFTEPGTGITYRIGKNPYAINSVRFAGVDPRDGQQMWYTKDGNLTKKYSEDNEVDLGKTFIAPWNGGFGVNGRYKGFALRADFNWSAKKYIFNATNWYINDPANAVSRNTNGSTHLLSVWTKPGDITDTPNLTDLYGQPQEMQPDSKWVENSSFIRLKNLTFSYSLPKSWMNAARMSDVTFHFTGRNLLTFTKFTGLDPEYENNVVHMTYPNTRQYEFGIEVSF